MIVNILHVSDFSINLDKTCGNLSSSDTTKQIIIMWGWNHISFKVSITYKPKWGMYWWDWP